MPSKKLPNIVLISIDDLRYDCLSIVKQRPLLELQGVSTNVSTPNLDRIISRGVLFRQAITSSTHTPPSHGSIFTGLNPPGHGIRAFFKTQLYHEVRTLAEILSETGYRCVHCSDFPYFKLLGLERGVHSSFENESIEYHDFLSANDSPIYFFLHFFDVHDPYMFSPSSLYEENEDYRKTISALANEYSMPLLDEPYPYIRNFQALMKKLFEAGALSKIYSLYIAGVNKFDRGVFARNISRLEETGIFENCIFILFSDHGEGPGKEAFGHGIELRDEMIRVPLAVSFPGSIPAGIELDTQVRLIDITPTILDILGQLGFPVDLPYQLDGRSLLPIIAGKEKEHRPAYSEVWYHTLSGEDMKEFIDECLDNRKILTPHYETYLHQRSLRYPPWKIILEGRETEETDISKTGSLSELFRAVFTSLMHRPPSPDEISFFENFLTAHPAGRNALIGELAKLKNFSENNYLYNIDTDIQETDNLLTQHRVADFLQDYLKLKADIDKISSNPEIKRSRLVTYNTQEEQQIIENKLKALGYL